MRRDPVVLGKDYILSGDDIGTRRPNDNQLVVGISGCGKSTSVIFPTMALMEHSNPICPYAKESDAYDMADYMHFKGYRSDILNVANPEKSTVAYDPMSTVETVEDMEALSAFIIHSNLKHTVDDYWNSKAKALHTMLMVAARALDPHAGYADVLSLFNRMIIKEYSSCISTPLDAMFERLEDRLGRDNYAVREYHAYTMLPPKTASCVRDTLSAALSNVFPESIRSMMRDKPQFSVEEFCSGKRALFVITNAVETNQEFYANLFYRSTIRQLLRYANTCPGAVLPRPVRLIFDDFACTAAIDNFEKDISLFRSAGISALILLQSENQMEAIYGADKAAIIRQNCCSYVYFPGGFDDRSCEIVSRRMNIPFDEVLYAPLGKVFIMQTGRRPIQIPRFETYSMPEYQDYLRVARSRNRRTGHSRSDDRSAAPRSTVPRSTAQRRSPRTTA